jgi:6-pyruvoyltetrahydropterin/6-carboxytetrahydropterin synthase
MNIVYLTRRERFNAAHRMFRSDWSDETNLEVFGKCSNPLWHGHNYVMYVTVKGQVNPETGCLVNLTHLSQIIKNEIIEKLDHKNINLEVNFMNGKIVSSENIAVEIWKQLEPFIELLGIKLHCIKIEETENNFVEYFGN